MENNLVNILVKSAIQEMDWFNGVWFRDRQYRYNKKLILWLNQHIGTRMTQVIKEAKNFMCGIEGLESLKLGLVKDLTTLRKYSLTIGRLKF